eukprot:CAMPEP_0194134294 /NCGR_PEP_ID=MMETSP0152-20130528/4370_1 /TAXON_ID=1049557 /ORGANISM="Thalassiothrix antarctica, Strain L6-D1" /LENGTH=292 /DNA_ID=CAMNT_0038829949 /DNA_START=150 /DNA_END=1028 /DNA_ORIENTATION=-
MTIRTTSSLLHHFTPTRSLLTTTSNSIISSRSSMMVLVPSSSTITDYISSSITRTFATKKKRLLRRKKRTQKALQPVRKKKAAEADTQHVDWVAFQNLISVDGFETGQTTYVRPDIGKRHRGGVKYKKYLEKREAYLKSVQSKDGKGKKREEIPTRPGTYPALRFNDEETKRLLDEAYAGLPQKTQGRRGTNNLRRQRNRWHAVRKSHKLHKKNRGVKQHEKRMIRRSRVVREVKEVKAEGPVLRETNAAYQQHVLEQWCRAMVENSVIPEKLQVAINNAKANINSNNNNEE